MVSHGDPVEQYYNYRKVAEGESGDLFCALHATSNEPVAIKVIPYSQEAKMEVIANELNMMKSSKHDNIVTYYKCLTSSDSLYVVMEYMDAGSLADILQCESVSMDEFHMAYIIKELLEALVFLHVGKKVHRDVKSDNVLFNMQGQVKLADFVHCAQLTESKPMRNAVVGTPYWMAPEVIRGDMYDMRADVWSLGIVVHEMITKDPPYIEHPPLKAVFLITTHGLPPIDKQFIVSTGLRDLYNQCTEMIPSKRPSASVLRDASIFWSF
jgi:p21-activated kinase 1